MPSRPPSPGDMFAINQDGEFAIAQCTHNHAKPVNYGSLLRVFPGVRASLPASLSELAAGPHQFLCFFPLQLAVRGGHASRLGTEAIPQPLRRFPLFKAGAPQRGGGYDPERWWLWDGSSEWFVGRLSHEQLSYPTRGVWNKSLWFERLQLGWRHEHDAVGKIL
jgi:hypothetical protein